MSKEFIKVEFWNCRGDRGVNKTKFTSLDIWDGAFLGMDDEEREEAIDQYRLEHGSSPTKIQLARYIHNFGGWGKIEDGENEGGMVLRMVDISHTSNIQYLAWEGEEEVVVIVESKYVNEVLGKLLMEGIIHIF